MIKNILTTKKRKSRFPLRKRQKGLQYIKEVCCTLPEILERYAAEIPNKTAIIYHHKKINYHGYNTLANSLANELLNIGVKRGDRIGLMLPRIPELVISFMGIAKAGAIVAPINYELTEEGIRAKILCLRVLAAHIEQAIRALLKIPIYPLFLWGNIRDAAYHGMIL
ncbi:AMP-binding protein [Candidatus Kuenenia stuttgartensis]|uniref:AMP-binding protein n=1 Tax=Kuenenia stuttgartiensis TaxID=174633 RepID=UPI00146D7569|nr:AMP-binding protein [Candidatus Kuenenia stuttgartiensis]